MSRALDTAKSQQSNSGPTPAYVAGKNAVINGGFDIWQRGTSSTGTGYVTADRWVSQSSGGTTTFARESTIVPTNSQYAMKWTQTTSAAYANIIQAIETANAIQFAGKTVTLSALVAASVNQGVAIELNYATTVDKTIAGAGWIQLTPVSGGSASPSSTTYIPASGVFAVPSNAKSLMVGITTISIPVGTTFYVDQVQLELGSSATSFSRAGGDIQGELAACQRYYFAAGWKTGKYPNSYQYSSPYFFKVPMRVSPTITYSDAVGNVSKMSTYAANDARTDNVSPLTVASDANVLVLVPNDTGTGASGPAMSINFTASAEL